MDLKLLIDALQKGTPRWVLWITVVGLIWQAFYTWSRDRFHDKQARSDLDLEERRFANQKALEKLRFGYDTRRWREDLGRQIAVKHIDFRSDEYAEIWRQIEAVATSARESGGLSPESTKSLAGKIKTWRYSKAALVAEETTRDAAMALQRAAWEYDGSTPAYRRMRQARTPFSQRAAGGPSLGPDITGLTIYQLTEQRTNIQKELEEHQRQFRMSSEAHQD